MATKIYNNSKNVIIETSVLIYPIKLENFNYEISNSLLTYYDGEIAKETIDVSDVEDKQGNTFASDVLLSDYLGAFGSVNYDTLAQSSPSATTLTDIYTVEDNVQIKKLSGIVCNRSATATSFRVAIRKNGDAIDNKHYIYYDVAIGGNDTFYFDYDIMMQSTDVVSVYCNDATLSFSIYGEKINIV